MMKEFANTKILVVGGAGFVGSNLMRHLLKESVSQIDIIDNLLSAEKENIPSDARIIFTEGSIANDEILKTLNDEYDYIFHMSCFHGNQNSIHDPLADHENNTLTTLKLFDKIKNFKKVKKVVYIGAGCAVAEKTFDEAEATIESDLVSLHMDSPYSISKIIGEYYAAYYHKQHQLPTVRARFQNVYGPGEILGAGQWRGTPSTIWRNVIPTFIYKSLKGKALPVENGGIATRDFIYVDDICRGLIACALKGKKGDVYNLASGVETSILELAQKINKITENETPIGFKPARDWDKSGRRFGSTIKSERELRFKAETFIEDGLEKTIKWAQSNKELIESNIAKHGAFLKDND